MRRTKVLNVAEKPSVAKGITEILSRGRFQRGNSLSQYNPVFEFEFEFDGQNVDMLVTSVSGHLMSTEFADAYKSWSSCDPMQLFEAPIVKFVSKEHLDIERNLQRLASSAQILVLWLDCDREGENISFEVIECCKKVNSRLKIQRAHFSSIQARDILRAIRTLGVPNELDSQAVDARQEIDLRIGAAFTRFQTLRLRNRFEGMPDSVISYGPCQFPTLGFVVERYLKIASFIPEKFWSITCSFKDDEGKSAEFEWKRGRLFDRLACLVLYEMCLETPEATVISIDRKRRERWRPLPLNTVALQKLAAQKLRMGAEQTMSVAEKLYNDGFISYPRTETDNFSIMKDDDLRSIIEGQTGHRAWGAYAQRLLDGEYNRPRSGKNDDKAHPPIHPVKAANDNDFPSAQHKNLYELVVRHFLACCSRDAVGHETVVRIEFDCGEQFTCKGLMITEKNYLEVYHYDRWTDKDIPVFRENQKLTPTSLLMRESSTVAPSLLSESDLISLMDRNGIGTDATIAQHIKTIQDRQYVTKNENNQFVPTQLGLALVEGYDSMGFELSKPYLRAKMEADMKRISHGTITKQEVLRTAIDMYRAVYEKASREAEKLDEAVRKYFTELDPATIANSTGGGGGGGGAGGPGGGRGENIGKICSACNLSGMALIKAKSGKFFVGCKGFPRCGHSLFLPNAAEVSLDTETCSNCRPSGSVRKLRFKFAPGSVPMYLPNEVVACIFCDERMSTLVRSNNAGPTTMTTTANNNTGRGYNNNNNNNYYSSNTNARSGNTYGANNSNSGSSSNWNNNSNYRGSNNTYSSNYNRNNNSDEYSSNYRNSNNNNNNRFTNSRGISASSSSSTSGSRSYNKRSYDSGDNDADDSKTKKQRKCSVCQQPGHNKKNCPNTINMD